jgi:hypothetical protein
MDKGEGNPCGCPIIIRDEQSCQRLCDHIINNPKNWEEDKIYGHYQTKTTFGLTQIEE